MAVDPGCFSTVSQNGWAVVYDVEDGTYVWGLYYDYEDAEKAQDECSREMRIEEHGEDWVKILPCHVSAIFGEALKEKGAI